MAGSPSPSSHSRRRDDSEDVRPLSSSAGATSSVNAPESADVDADYSEAPTPMSPRTPFTPAPNDADDDFDGEAGTSAAGQRLTVDGDDVQPIPAAGDGADDLSDADADGNPSAQAANGNDEEEEEGEDLYGDDMLNDYRPLDQLDRYEVDETAERDEVAPMSAADRRNAERAMRRREGRNMQSRGSLGSSYGLLNNDDSDAEENRMEMTRRRARNSNLVARYRASQDSTNSPGSPGMESQGRSPLPGGTPASEDGHGTAGVDDRGTPMSIGGDEQENGDLDFEAQNGSLKEWVTNDGVRRQIYRRCAGFLRGFADATTGSLVYMDRIRLMAATNSQTLVVSYPNFFSTEPTISIWLADEPAAILEIFNEAATDVTFSIFSEYGSIHPEIFVRISNLPVLDQLRDIRHIHLNTLIKVSGVVTRRSGVFPHLRVVKLTCEKCNTVTAPTATSKSKPEQAIQICPGCGGRGPFTVNSEQTVFGNFQKLNLQESPGRVPAGRLPRYKEVFLLNDLIDSARPGDEIEVTGIYRHNIDPTINIMNGFPVFSTVIEANYVRKVEDSQASSTMRTELTDDDVKEIRSLSHDPRVADRIFASIAPSIYGHANIKKAIALALFGGQAKEVGEKHRMRGDINVLLLGDPGTAKSQFLKYIEKTANRAVYTTGKGASAVGLTAAVHKDPVTREWTLEGGALVLADRGVCLIDEFDKMNDADRTSIHEAMEQQSISISKAGIVTTLRARCSVFAAANPVKGRYDASMSFFDNVDLTEPILSRFDVLCVVRDTVDPVQDETLAKFVVDSHMRSHPDEDAASDAVEGEDKPVLRAADVGASLSDSGVELVPQELLRKYIMYARSSVSPKLANMDREKISALYIDLRKESMASGGMPIALRHLESIVRLAEAHARLHLREYVREDDINAAISVMLESFFASQKYAVMRSLRKHFHKYLAYRKDDNELLFYVLSSLVRDYAAAQGAARGPAEQGPRTVEIDLEDFEARAREMNVHSCDAFYASALFRERQFALDRVGKRIVKTV